MEQSELDRINELYRKQKGEGLTEAEKTEQAKLRKRFLAEFRANMKAQLDNTKIKYPDGRIVDLGVKYGGKKPKN